MTKTTLQEQRTDHVPSKLNVFQIYYNDETRQAILPNFIPLDNTENLRPDWAEYWPIRNYFINNQLYINDWYGFLSPMFTVKTDLTDSQVMAFLNQYKDQNYDAIIFSPFWNQTAYFQNQFEQGDEVHPNLSKITQKFLQAIRSQVKLSDVVAHSQNTVWSNYIIAKPKFWARWFTITNALFFMAETKEHPLYAELNGLTQYNDSNTHTNKIFILERLATLLFATEPWRIKAFDTFQLPSHNPILDPYRNELIVCDSLKQNYAKTGDKQYLLAYRYQRQVITEKAITEKFGRK